MLAVTLQRYPQADDKFGKSLPTATSLHPFYRQTAAIKPSVVRSHNEVAKGKIANGNLFANLRILAFEVHSTATDTTEAQQ